MERVGEALGERHRREHELIFAPEISEVNNLDITRPRSGREKLVGDVGSRLCPLAALSKRSNRIRLSRLHG